jgi:WD40 repeat protein
LNCVAFSPKGTILATGDNNGAVVIRMLASSRGSEVLWLEHVGPILKLGFSPDGRVLAALAKPAKEESEARRGVIRLWVTTNWEKDVEASNGKGPTSGEHPRPQSPGTPAGDRGTSRP